MEKVKVAVIGCGTISPNHIKAYTKNERTDIKYLVDIRPERAKKLAEKFHVPHTTTDFREILHDKELEAVSICTPNDTHAKIAIACLDAGKHVLCEKPAAINMKQVNEMKAAAERNKRILNIGVVNRYNTAVNKIKEMIDNGDLGNVYHVYCSFRAHRSIPGLGGPFTTKSKSGGGVLIDWGVHYLDLIFYSLNQPKILTVSGTTHSELAKNMKDYTYINMWAGPPDYTGTYDVDDFVTGLIRTSGPTISLNGAWAQNIGEPATFVEFLGDKAGVKWQYGGNFTVYSAKDGVLYETIPAYAQKDMFYEEIDGFIQSVMSDMKSRSNIDNVLVTSEVMEAIYTSSEQGSEVTL
ncbi:Gfo/Idh/MocA family protein [Lederbergia galactosidilytica]|uniref:Oxidoreductase n=1 Tax=Lederbergia galactosidilytica TaxID=217031 RepID=A0A177ZGH1_9BACI|nr:Gfo/Idh/MocA family oxidoreductase [Lederbergia galactosidilytica]OAK67097.1 oxidoreductase [Lederbergia galactosidilytica]